MEVFNDDLVRFGAQGDDHMLKGRLPLSTDWSSSN